LERAGGLLGQCQVLLAQVVYGLVLVDLHTGAHITVSMQEEREGARQVFSEYEREREREVLKLSSNMCFKKRNKIINWRPNH